MDKRIEKLYELLQDEDFAAKFKGVSADEAIAILAENGLEFTSEELKALDTLIPEENTELDNSDLDKVAGGISWKQYKRGLKSTLRGFVDGLKWW